MYCPKPIDTSEVKLPDEMLALTEKIAENVHDVWAKAYDRNTAFETLRLIVKLGYHISKKD